jgi:hypothetical membrane protein
LAKFKINLKKVKKNQQKNQWITMKKKKTATPKYHTQTLKTVNADTSSKEPNMPNQKTLQKIGAAFGFAVPIVAFTCISAAILSYPQFSWTNNALSDLGVVPGFTAAVFNVGLFTAGLLGVLFAVLGLFNYFKDSLFGKAGSLVFGFAMIWLIAIGIFNENYRPAHFIVSVLFFATLPIALWIITAALYRRHEVKLAVFTLIASFTAAAPWILYYTIQYVPNVAIPETISGLTGAIWAIIISHKIIKTAKT